MMEIGAKLIHVNPRGRYEILWVGGYVYLIEMTGETTAEGNPRFVVRNYTRNKAEAEAWLAKNQQ